MRSNRAAETDLQTALTSYLIGLGDDELILGQRDSEWCGHAPILEEDIAFANLALDEIGHAAIWYGLAADLVGEEPTSYSDRLVYTRPPEEYRNVQLVELPKGDWAFSMLRQFLFDTAENTRLLAMKTSSMAAIQEAAEKIHREELYHLRHTRAWVERLSLGTEESHTRMQAALDALWPLSGQLFTTVKDESLLVKSGYMPRSTDLWAAWKNQVQPFLERCQLSLPSTDPIQIVRVEHTPHLKVLLAEMQSVARMEPEAGW
jgi:ring-1,2-phenylacetyl-CoA epoxidase subunit PaaC